MVVGDLCWNNISLFDGEYKKTYGQNLLLFWQAPFFFNIVPTPLESTLSVSNIPMQNIYSLLVPCAQFFLLKFLRPTPRYSNNNTHKQENNAIKNLSKIHFSKKLGFLSKLDESQPITPKSSLSYSDLEDWSNPHTTYHFSITTNKMERKKAKKRDKNEFLSQPPTRLEVASKQ